MDDGLAQGDGCGVTTVAWHVAAGIVEKWRRQHMSDFDGGVTQAPGLELRGEILGQPRVVMPGNGDGFLRHYLVEGIARICLDRFFRVKTQILTLDGWIW